MQHFHRRWITSLPFTKTCARGLTKEGFQQAQSQFEQFGKGDCLHESLALWHSLFQGNHLLFLVLVVVHLRTLGQFPVAGRSESFFCGSGYSVGRVLSFARSLHVLLQSATQKQTRELTVE